MSILQKARAHGISRKYLRLSALYRRASRPALADFSFDALLACFRYESNGGTLPPNSNGYLAGKRFMDVTVNDAKKAISSGDFCKAEFYFGPTGWYWRQALKTVHSKPSFAYERLN